MNWSKPIAWAVLGCLLTLAHADPFDKVIREEMDRQHIPGVAIEIVRDGRVIKREGYGFADLEAGVKVTPNSVFEIGSATKQFTAAAILLLQDRGQLSVDDTLGKYLTDIPDAWQKLTLRQVLNHSAGLKDYLGSQRLNDLGSKPASQLIDPIRKLPLDFDPGTGWAYSNTGFLLAGMVVEKVSGKPLATYLDTQFFKPLSMKTMTTTDPTVVVLNRARGYSFDGKGYVNAVPMNPTLAGGAGLLMGSVDDLTKWLDSLSPQHLLSLKALDTFTTPVSFTDGTTGSYGFGQFMDWDRGQAVFAHGGNTAGFSADLYRVPGRKLTIVVLTNKFGVDPEPISRRLATIAVPEMDLATRKPYRDPFPKLTSKLQSWFADSSRGKVDRTIFATSFAAQFKTMRGISMTGSFVTLGKSVRGVTYLDQDDRGLSGDAAMTLKAFETTPVKPPAPPKPLSKGAKPATPPIQPKVEETPNLPVAPDRYIRYKLDTDNGTAFIEIHWTAKDQIAWLAPMYLIPKPKLDTPSTPKPTPGTPLPNH